MLQYAIQPRLCSGLTPAEGIWLHFAVVHAFTACPPDGQQTGICKGLLLGNEAILRLVSEHRLAFNSV